MAELKIKADSGGGTVSLKGPATTTSNAAVQLTLPVDDGTTGQYLKTDGSGALSWSTVSAGTALTGSTDNTICTVTGANAIQGEAELVFDGNKLGINRTSNLQYGISFPASAVDNNRIGWHSSDGTKRAAIGLDDGDGDALKFYTGSSTTERLEIDTSGNAKIADGNLVISTSGHGIDFSATADSGGTSTSEVLADYEVGTWSPAFTNAPTISGAHGSYIKVGDMVFAYWQFNTSSDGPASHARINNLPFTSTAANPACGGTAWDYRTNSAINAHQSPGTTSLFFYHQNGTAMMGDSAEFESEEFRGCTIYQTA